MRWSWPAFAAGSAVGVLVCLLLLWDREPVEIVRWVREPRREGTARGGDVPEVRSPRDAANARTVDPPETAPKADEPSAPGAETSGGDPGSGEEHEAQPSFLRGAVVTADGSAITLVGFEGATLNLRSSRTLTFVLADASPSANPVAVQGLARARAAAEALAADGRRTSPSDVDEMLGSSDDTTRETAIGLAARAEPPLVDRLVRTARDESAPGSLRTTALLAAVEAAPEDATVVAAVVELTSDRNVDVRRTAVSLLDRAGPRGADRAVQMLRDGDYAGDLLGSLARTVAVSDRALTFLLGQPAPETAFAVLRAIGETQPADEAARARLVARLPDAVRPLLADSEMPLHAGEAFGALAAAGHSAFLRSVAVTPSLPTAVRLAAVDAAVAAPACADGRAALLAATLADGRSPVELLRAVVQRVPAEDVADGGVKAALRALALDHPNQWLREEARAKLQAAPPPGEGGSLRIVSGTYGKDGHTVDVTPVLASMVVGGRLVVEAGNALAGDPLVGTVKDLAVVYEWKGERRTRTIHEYETLTLP